MCEQRIVMKNDCTYAVADIASVSSSNTTKSPIFPLFYYIRTTMCYNRRYSWQDEDVMYISGEEKQRELRLFEIAGTEPMKVLNV